MKLKALAEKTSGENGLSVVRSGPVSRSQFNHKQSAHRRAFSLGILAAFSFAVLLSGCLSPTLPLPPPSRPDVTSPDDDGFIRISGVVQSRATVFARNQRTDEIVGEVTGADGAYDLTMRADVGDRIAVWQSVYTKESGSTEVVVPDVTVENGPPPDPNPMGGSAGD